MKKINRRSFLAAAGLTAAALALTACGGSASSTASSTASSAASSEAASTSAAAELTTVEAGKLTMATNAAFPPYEMTTDAGEFEGIDIDTAKAIAEKLGLELQIDDMDFDAALLSVQQGKADIVMAGVTVTDERKAVMDFSDATLPASSPSSFPRALISPLPMIWQARRSAPSVAPPATSTALMTSAMTLWSHTTTA